MSDRCNAYLFGKQCRATKNLTGVIITPHVYAYAAFKIVGGVAVNLCPKHFVMKKVDEAQQ